MILLIMWLLWSGHYTPLLIGFGVVSCVIVLVLTRRMDIVDEECAPLLGLTWQLGLVVGVAAMFGDACSSFIKRRLGMPSGAMALGLDHVPESLFPLIASRAWVALSWPEVSSEVTTHS